MSKARHSRGIEKSVTQFLNSQLKTCTYNQNQRLTRVTDTGNVLGEYVYNGNGQRADKLIPSQNKCTVFHYDQNGLLITESTRTGNIKAEYVYLNGQPLAKIEGNNVYYYHNDHLGTPMVMTDESGSVVWSGEYLPFGEPLSVSGSVTNNLRFPGQYYDAETALNYNWFRYYDSKLGRYPQADPIGLLGGVNLFTYTGNSPCNRIDPLGLDDLSDLEPSGSILMIWYGNWGGPGWTGGQRGTWNSINQSAAKPPIDKQDACYRDHDICYGSCRDNKSCKSSSRANCFKNCDRKLSRCLRSLGKDPSNNWQAKAAAILFENRNPGADQ